MNSQKTFVWTGIFLLILTLTATAAYPPFINYQGRLTDTEGNPVPDGLYSLTFTIWDSYTDGNAIWVSDPMSINTANGLFDVLLGVIPSSVFIPAADRFLGIKIGENPELAPRTWLVAVPYAYYAGNAYASETCPAWTINGDDIFHSQGKVGIGVNNPGEILVVGDDIGTFPGECITMGNNAADGRSRIIVGEDVSNWVSFELDNLQDRFSILHEVGGMTYYLIRSVNGKVGIGMNNSPEFTLHVMSHSIGDGMRIDNYMDNQLFRVRENSDHSCEIQVSDNTGAVKAMVRGNGDSYFTGGDVGIGTTSPNYTLDVRGTIGNNTTLYHSDRRWKKDIAPLNDALKSITCLRGVSYKWKQDEFPEMNFPSGRQIGLIAQEVESVVPEVVNTANDGYKSIDYARLIAVMTEAIKTQQEQIENLKSRIEDLEKAK